MTHYEYTARKKIEKELKFIEMKDKANRLRAKGYSIVEIAMLLGVTERTVHNYISVNGGY